MTFKQFIPAMVWLALSVVLLCLPGSAIPKYSWLALIHADKWIHITLFFILCFLFSFPFKRSSLTKNEKLKWFVLITLTGIAYGTLMEFVQDRWVPNRSFELLDIVADSTGSALALIYSLRKFLRGGL